MKPPHEAKAAAALAGGKNEEIEKLRGIAVIFVILWHYQGLTLDVMGLDRNSYALWTGVDLFFSISGFVITKSLLKSLGHGRLRDYLSEFYIKRIFRIIPPALCCIALSLLATFLLRHAFGQDLFKDTLADALPAALNYANFSFYFKTLNHGGTLLGIFWSLSLEEQFYLVIPLLIWWLKRKPTLLICLLGLLAGVQFFQAREPWKTLMWSIRTDALIYGVVIAFAEARCTGLYNQCKKINQSIRPVVSLLAVPLLVILLAVVASNFFRRFTGLPTSWAGITSAFLVFLASLEQGLVLNFKFIGSALIWVGSRSYALYLIHNLILLMAKGINAKFLGVHPAPGNPGYYLFIFLTLAFLFASADIFYRLLERPSKNFGRRLSRSLRPSVADGLAPALAQLNDAG